MPTEASLRNLKPFAPGKSGNPGGRPRKRVLSGAYEDWLRMKVDAATLLKLREKGHRIPENATNADLVALRTGQEALAGNVLAAKEMREACEGKPGMRFELSPGSEGFQVNVVFEEPREKLLHAQQTIDV